MLVFVGVRGQCPQIGTPTYLFARLAAAVEQRIACRGEFGKIGLTLKLTRKLDPRNDGVAAPVAHVDEALKAPQRARFDVVAHIDVRGEESLPGADGEAKRHLGRCGRFDPARAERIETKPARKEKAKLYVLAGQQRFPVLPHEHIEAGVDDGIGLGAIGALCSGSPSLRRMKTSLLPPRTPSR